MSTASVFVPSSSRKNNIHALCLIALLPAMGCLNSAYLERWGGGQYGQGDIARQSARAVMFDPYPFNDMGPEVVGGRPREFAIPMPEAERNKLERRLPGSNVPVLPGFGQPVPANPGMWGAPTFQQPVPSGAYSGGFVLPQFGAYNSSMMPANTYPQAPLNSYPAQVPMAPIYQGIPAN